MNHLLIANTFSSQSVASMIIVALICTAVPFIFLAYYHTKSGAKIASFFIGMGFYLLFAFGAEGLLNVLVFRVLGAAQFMNRDSHPVIYALYGAITVGAFQEIAKYIALKKCMNRFSGKKNALLFGVGQGGLEAIAYGSSLFMGNIIVAFMVNSMGIDVYFQKLGIKGDTLIQQKDALYQLIATPASEYVWYGVERILALILQASLTVLIFTAINYKKFKYLFPIAIALHIIGYVPTYLSQVGIISNHELNFVLTGTIVIFVAILGYKIFHKLPEEVKTKEQKKFPNLVTR